jgi:uncharacterized protein (DUF983 family)
MMPDVAVSPFDDPFPKAGSAPEPASDPDPGRTLLPTSGWDALLRGASNRCPRCGRAKLFVRFLKPAARCAHCGQDWTHQRADDFPAYIAIFLTGHLLAPVIILLVGNFRLPVAMLAAIIVPLAAIIVLGLLQPAKGAVIALQWWLGMHGFQRDRSNSRDDDRQP